ncbi:glycosyltransferase family 2 protein [Bordetella genomosp. 13]|uniref:Glycosyl transferase family 2 n=1 Tax=Bordetella genomosp. 13 TaxID=463040 RepID=A0A1W6ZA77_9BORD|nr:glycosyltransferase [Bordetella genomosp. 13]ARP94145.1 glycosyl transferase family 2 [Bordetella genomosp. 13]
MSLATSLGAAFVEFPVSVVVPTYRRPDMLARCLEALLTQDFTGAYEIVVCDDEPGARTEALVASLAGRCRKGGPTLRYLAISATQGPAAARNQGWQAARGEIIAFTDDDTEPAPDWLTQGVHALKPGVHAVAGRIEMPLPQRPTDYERDASGLSRAEFATANCFVRRAALQAVGGFDTRFEMAWREDSDLHFSLLEHGFVVENAPDAVVVHPIRPAPFGVGLRMQRKVMYDTLLYAKHPRLYRARVRQGPPWFYLSVTGALVVCLAAAAAGAWWVAAVAGVIWLALTASFFARRLEGLSRAPSHVAELALTSVAIPPLSIGWRIVGMFRYGRRFP